MIQFTEIRKQARQAIESQNLKSDDLGLLAEIDEVYEDEKVLAERFGCCFVGCRASNLIETEFGTLCKWTRRECQSQKLAATANLLSNINKGQEPVFIQGVHSDCHISR